MAKTKRSSKKKLRLAFIGAGGIAQAHLDALAKMDEVEVVALADPIEGPMLEKADKYGIGQENCFTDYKRMLAKVGPDAVSVCTPNGQHAPNTIDALKAGAHVIVEKPMAMNAKEAKSMIAAAKKARKKLVIGFQYRYDPKTQFLKQAADNGRFGDIRFARVQALRRRGIPNWGVFGRKDLQGGGPMIDIGVHMLEQTHYLMGAPKPVAATGMIDTYLGNKPSNKIEAAWKGWDHKTYTVEDLAVGHIRFENGAVIHIEASFAAHIEKEFMGFQIMGTEGGATWDPPVIFTDRDGHMTDVRPHYLPPHPDFYHYFDLKLRNFVDHVLYNKPTMAPAEHGLMVQQMLDAVYASAEKGGAEVKIS